MQYTWYPARGRIPWCYHNGILWYWRLGVTYRLLAGKGTRVSLIGANRELIGMRVSRIISVPARSPPLNYRYRGPFPGSSWPCTCYSGKPHPAVVQVGGTGQPVYSRETSMITHQNSIPDLRSWKTSEVLTASLTLNSATPLEILQNGSKATIQLRHRGALGRQALRSARLELRSALRQSQVRSMAVATANLQAYSNAPNTRCLGAVVEPQSQFIIGGQSAPSLILVHRTSTGTNSCQVRLLVDCVCMLMLFTTAHTCSLHGLPYLADRMCIF